MKQTAITAFLLAALLFLTSCGAPQTSAPGAEDAANSNVSTQTPSPEPTEPQTFIGQPKGESFVERVFQALPKNKNYCISPLSAKLAFAMVANGAEGEGRREILEALDIGSLDEYNHFVKEFLTAFPDNRPDQLQIANSIWLNTDAAYGMKFKEGFQEAISAHYNGTADVVNHSNAVDTINSWISEKTSGKITRAVEDSRFIAALVNTVYFKALWQDSFPTSAKPDSFTDRDGKSSQVDFMNLSERLRYAENSKMQAVCLPYLGAEAMYILLPKEGQSVSVKDLDNAFLQKMTLRKVRLSMPKWNITSSFDLRGLMKALGIQTVFDESRSTLGTSMFDESILAAGPVFLDRCLQKTVIQVDEKGTEAAAVSIAIASAAGTEAPEVPVEFKADHPFLFLIRHEPSGEILFFGEYLYAQNNANS